MSLSSTTKTKIKNGPLMDKWALKDALRYVIAGRLSLKEGHLPVAGHRIPDDFVSVGVSTATDPAVDDFVLAQLETLKIQQVRIDFTYGDESSPVGRLLEKLLATKLQVLLHLVQPFEAAQQMKTPSAQRAWIEFVRLVTDKYGAGVFAIEVGSTSNRRSWAGYDTEGFYAAWSLAYDEIKSRNITLVGPNISDFEPLHNIAVLTRLQRENKLPDMHSDNLFSERVIEPERFDHRIFGVMLANFFKVNLVKKARLLKKITTDFKVKDFISPAAFWTLPRIERLLPDSEQKMADYLSRYLTLCAASGAMRQAAWGPLICAREGLIDDGSASYPVLERITHYRSVLGEVQDFRLRPAFNALKNFIKLIPGSVYQGAHATTQGIEIHVFRRQNSLIHVAWTANGKAIPLVDLYQSADLSRANYIDRDGHSPSQAPQLVTESPLFINWPVEDEINLIPTAASARIESIHHHIADRQYYAFDDGIWRGMAVAKNAAEAELFFEKLHPNKLPQPNETNLLRKARNAIWTVDNVLDRTVVAKKPLKMHPHKRILDRHKPSKARRSWISAAELSRRGVATALPIAYFEKKTDPTQLQNYFICEYTENDFTSRAMLTAFRDGALQFQGLTPEVAYPQLTAFLLNMHNHGIFFRDLAGGNILVKKTAPETLHFTLVDINRARFFNRSAILKERISDLTRLCHKLHWAGRDYLVGLYLEGLPQKPRFNWRLRLPFYLYDAKVNFKRKYGRKAIKRLFNGKQKT